jgi:hypothetical protein
MHIYPSCHEAHHTHLNVNYFHPLIDFVWNTENFDRIDESVLHYETLITMTVLIGLCYWIWIFCLKY